MHAAVPPGGILLADLKKQLGAVADLGFAHAKRLKWLDIDKIQGAPMVVRKVGSAWYGLQLRTPCRYAICCCSAVLHNCRPTA